ncbi:DUF2809 domain-containing protein [Myceligenerans sp. TRM 65318]|uniref:DUF2809 domain-containing protein n=2 Tax=Myceligenerans pegani TaxID=2776917 RepID=A0ABR9MV36_9MICO|nr:DUF2809 domain-containing protein [Myceligenerans sp. TRM 65318]MBE3017519.1 DUF2809 domain-containing protein [Myceligenerans sp. TRM 65318]
MPRSTSVLIAVVVVLAGLGARAALPGVVGGPVGDALYATLVVLLVVLVRPRTSPVAAALAGFAVCLAIELFQLTGIPVAVAERFPLARIVLGTTFWAPDLLRYAAGAALGGVLCRIGGRRAVAEDAA